MKIVSRELEKYKLDFVGVLEVRWDKHCTESANNYTFFHGNWNTNYELKDRLFCI
jgi:hypothetical protein